MSAAASLPVQLVGRLGRGSLRFVGDAGRLSIFLGAILTRLVRPPFRPLQIISQFEFVGARSTGIVSLAINGKLERGLEPWAEAVRKLARSSKVPLVDLYRESITAVQALGPVRANTLAEVPPSAEVLAASRTGNSIDPIQRGPDAAGLLPPPLPEFDYTHVGPTGADLFADIVARGLRTSAALATKGVGERTSAGPNSGPFAVPGWSRLARRSSFSSHTG